MRASLRMFEVSPPDSGLSQDCRCLRIENITQNETLVIPKQIIICFKDLNGENVPKNNLAQVTANTCAIFLLVLLFLGPSRTRGQAMSS